MTATEKQPAAGLASSVPEVLIGHVAGHDMTAAAIMGAGDGLSSPFSRGTPALSDMRQAYQGPLR